MAHQMNTGSAAMKENRRIEVRPFTMPFSVEDLMRKILWIAVLLAPVAFTVACSSNKPSTASNQTESKPADTAPKAPDLSTGREEFQRLYGAARGWAADARPFRLQSETVTDAPGHDGKAGAWRASFASASRANIKTWMWSGIGDPKERGITPGTEDTYNPSNTSTQPFELAFLKNDSDKAFEVAQRHGGDKLLKENPKLPVFYVLDWDGRENTLIWHVIYGENRNDAKLRIAVNATTGAFIKKER
jgi:hypothetical protein